jgi:hypothetical protein
MQADTDNPATALLSIVCTAVTFQCFMPCDLRFCGQGRGRTVDLPIFRCRPRSVAVRPVVPVTVRVLAAST